MSVPTGNTSERRLSVGNRNAYIIIKANESETNKKIDDSAYLTAKPANRVRFFSEGSSSTGKQTTEQHTSGSPQPTTSPHSETTAKKVQVGMDRYITILKRQRSPNSSKTAPLPKISKASERVNYQNRFALLANESHEPKEVSKPFKPPPIYLRESNTNDIIKGLVALIGANSFYVTRMKRGNFYEIKIQVNHENDYRKIVADFEAKKKSFYTYQLKSAKGLQVVIKGIDSSVSPDEIKDGLKDKGFLIKNVVNIKNKEKVPQPMFRVELQPGDIQLKKNETHPIYDLRYLLHRRVTVEEPHKRKGPVQCLNCQEYGHTKAYCKLPPVCVICGELHNSVVCNKSKNDSKVKKCSNCGGNHTANYRGCPIFIHVKRTAHQRPAEEKVQPQTSLENPPLIPLPVSNQFSYADILKTGQTEIINTTKENKQVPTINLQPQIGTPEFNFSHLEKTIENLVQTTNNFTNMMSHLLNKFTSSMSTMMTEMMKMQQMLLQALTKKP